MWAGMLVQGEEEMRSCLDNCVLADDPCCVPEKCSLKWGLIEHAPRLEEKLEEENNEIKRHLKKVTIIVMEEGEW